MCRIFGFRSVLLSKVHSSLVSAENALMGQSRRHPDGWGLAYYIAETPHIVKSTNTAETDELFKKISGIVSSQTVLAHIRKATHGKLSLTNTHPFQYGKWTFAHNGNIKQFEAIKEQMLSFISPNLSPYYLGETDSELFFYFLLTYLEKEMDLHGLSPDLKLSMSILEKAMLHLNQIIGDLNIKDVGVPTDNYLTFVLSNGPMMVALNGGMGLYYSTHKKRCPEREICGSFASFCEAAPDSSGRVNHLIFSSEPLQGENIWIKMNPGELIGVAREMVIERKHLKLNFFDPS
ncbi:MAG: class II glutamine amidotransferase [Bacteriovoracaceae bacterium]